MTPSNQRPNHVIDACARGNEKMADQMLTAFSPLGAGTSMRGTHKSVTGQERRGQDNRGQWGIRWDNIG